MRDQSVLKHLMQRQAREATGRYGSQPMTQRAQAQLGLSEPDLLALPQDISALQDIQNADGSFKFMAGFSAAGGPDVIG